MTILGHAGPGFGSWNPRTPIDFSAQPEDDGGVRTDALRSTWAMTECLVAEESHEYASERLLRTPRAMTGEDHPQVAKSRIFVGRMP